MFNATDNGLVVFAITFAAATVDYDARDDTLVSLLSSKLERVGAYWERKRRLE